MALLEAEAVPKTTCKATTKTGGHCKGRANQDGYCMVHSPSRTFDPAQTGRNGGLESARVRRARAEARREAKNGRDLIREKFESDPAMQAAALAVYEQGLRAMTKDGNPDHQERRQQLSALLAEAYGKPQQNIQTKHDVTINVVNRTREALASTHADVDLEAVDVTVLEA